MNQWSGECDPQDDRRAQRRWRCSSRLVSHFHITLRISIVPRSRFVLLSAESSWWRRPFFLMTRSLDNDVSTQSFWMHYERCFYIHVRLCSSLSTFRHFYLLLTSVLYCVFGCLETSLKHLRIPYSSVYIVRVQVHLQISNSRISSFPLKIIIRHIPQSE